MRSAYKPKPVPTQADHAQALLRLIWGCDDRRARDLDAAQLLASRGISRRSLVIDVTQAVAARKGRVR